MRDSSALWGAVYCGIGLLIVALVGLLFALSATTNAMPYVAEAAAAVAASPPISAGSASTPTSQSRNAPAGGLTPTTVIRAPEAPTRVVSAFVPSSTPTFVPKTPSASTATTTLGASDSRVAGLDILWDQVGKSWAVGDWPGAISALKGVRAIDPGYAGAVDKLYAAYINYGRALAKEGRDDEAIGQFRLALVVRPGGVEALLALEGLGATESGLLPTPTSSPTSGPTSTPTSSPTRVVPVPTRIVAPPSPTSTPTPRPQPTATPTAIPTPTSIPTPTAVPSRTPIPTSTPTRVPPPAPPPGR